MNWRREVCVILFSILGLYAVPVGRCSDAPAWMHALTSAPLPKHDEKTEAVLLYQEEILTVLPNGKVKEVDRAAYKILRPSGRHFGRVTFHFDSETKISRIRGWCIPAQGKDYEVKDKDITESGVAGMAGGELYSDHRVKLMDIPAPDPGNIVGYEVEHDDRPYVLEDAWGFQESVPTALARYTLQLPAGWEYKAMWVNHSEAQPTAAGNNQWQWELRDIPEIKWEPDMPPWRGVSGMMLVTLLPPGGAKRGFLTWSDLGAWENNLTQGRRDASPEIKQKVTELTANAATPAAKMAALAEFMQRDIRYVGIWLGIGGYQPHSAQEVFTHRYGDCKDKATLLSSMLNVAGFESYYVVIHTQRGGVTTTSAPQMGAFNHVILAIRLPDGVNDPRLVATINHPKLGKLVIFDPTDELTPFGTLRGALQANYGLLVTNDGGELTRMPQLSPDMNGTTRTARLTLDTRGGLQGTVHESRIGDSAWWQREELRSAEKDADRIKPIETLMSNSLSSFQITKATVSNLAKTSEPFGYDWTFTAPEYAKAAGGLMLVRPRLMGVKAEAVMETKEPRQYPVEFRGPTHDIDVFEITIPAGYEVDDLPPPADVEYSFGSYHSKVEAQGGVIKYSRTYEIRELSVPVEKTDDLKKFYRIIASDERNTAVLKPVVH